MDERLFFPLAAYAKLMVLAPESVPSSRAQTVYDEISRVEPENLPEDAKVWVQLLLAMPIDERPPGHLSSVDVPGSPGQFLRLRLEDHLRHLPLPETLAATPWPEPRYRWMKLAPLTGLLALGVGLGLAWSPVPRPQSRVVHTFDVRELATMRDELAGFLSLAAGRNEIAATHFQDAIRSDGEALHARRGLGFARWRQGRFEDAVEAYRSALFRPATEATPGLEDRMRIEMGWIIKAWLREDPTASADIRNLRYDLGIPIPQTTERSLTLLVADPARLPEPRWISSGLPVRMTQIREGYYALEASSAEARLRLTAGEHGARGCVVLLGPKPLVWSFRLAEGESQFVTETKMRERMR